MTAALLLRGSTRAQMVIHFSYTMKSITPLRIRIRRFITDRYTCRAQPNYLSELVVFGIITLTAFWPILVLARTMAGTLR